MVLSRAIANNIYTICGTPSLERRYPASRNGGFTAQEYSVSVVINGYNITFKDFSREISRLLAFIDFHMDNCITDNFEAGLIEGFDE